MANQNIKLEKTIVSNKASNDLHINNEGTRIYDNNYHFKVIR
jgi:hypothetical protein